MALSEFTASRRFRLFVGSARLFRARGFKIEDQHTRDILRALVDFVANAPTLEANRFNSVHTANLDIVDQAIIEPMLEAIIDDSVAQGVDHYLDSERIQSILELLVELKQMAEAADREWGIAPAGTKTEGGYVLRDGITV